MKTIRRIITILLSMAIFFIGLMIGIFVLCFFSMERQEANNHSRAHRLAEEYRSSGNATITSSSRHDYVIFFDKNREQKDIFQNMNGECPHQAIRLSRRMIPVILKGSEIDRFIIVPGFEGKVIGVFFITGVPVIENGSIDGAAFLVLDQMYFSDTIIIFAVYFAFFYWIVAISVIANQHKRRQLEETRLNYIANVTHALKTPVASVMALSETLLDEVEPDPELRRNYVEMIYDESQRQSEMIQNILVLSKLQSHDMKYSKREYTLKEMIEPVRAKYQPLCDNKKITLEADLDAISNLPPVYTDAPAVRQILGIALDNAMKFTDAGGKISIGAKAEKKHAVIYIEDNGAGIDSKSLKHVFDRFYASKSSEVKGGNGLGLSIAKGLAEGINEKIWIESESQKGTTLFLTIQYK